jgi:hypothetical protein
VAGREAWRADLEVSGSSDPARDIPARGAHDLGQLDREPLITEHSARRPAEASPTMGSGDKVHSVVEEQ